MGALSKGSFYANGFFPGPSTGGGTAGTLEFLATVDFTTMATQTIGAASGNGTIDGGAIKYGHTTGGSRGLVIDSDGLYTSGSGFANTFRLDLTDMCGVDFSGTSDQLGVALDFEEVGGDPQSWIFYVGGGAHTGLGAEYAYAYRIVATQWQWGRVSAAHGAQNSTNNITAPLGIFLFGDPGSPRYSTVALANPPVDPFAEFPGWGRSVISDSKLVSVGPGAVQFYWDGAAINSRLKLKRLHFYRLGSDH